MRRVQKLIGRRVSVPDEYDCGAIIAVARVAKVVTSSRSAWFSLRGEEVLRGS